MLFSYLWVLFLFLFFTSRRGSLGLVQCPLLFLSANEESIFKVAIETIVFVVTAIGAAGRARFCYFCHESTPDTHARVPPVHTRTHVTCRFFFFLLSRRIQMQADTSKAVSRTRCLSHIKQYTGVRMFHPFFSGTRHPETSSP